MKLRRSQWRRVPVLLCLAVMAGQSFQAPTDTQKTTDPQKEAARQEGIEIGIDDTVTIVALYVDEISKQWRVGTSGDLSLPMVGRIHVAGKTVEEVEQELAERLKDYVREPQVTVFVSEYRSRPVTVSGAVEKPGTIQLNGPTPLYSAIVEVGGAKDMDSVVTVARDLQYGPIARPDARTSPDGKFSVVQLPLQEAMRGDGDGGRLMLLPYDSVRVSTEKRPRLVYIAGEVNRPGAIELVSREEVSLTQALAMAGGLTHLASASKAVVRHINSKGIETAFQFMDLTKVIKGKAKDPLLSDGDIIVVPSSQLATYLQAATTTAITGSVYLLGKL